LIIAHSSIRDQCHLDSDLAKLFGSQNAQSTRCRLGHNDFEPPANVCSYQAQSCDAPRVAVQEHDSSIPDGLDTSDGNLVSGLPSMLRKQMTIILQRLLERLEIP